MVAAKNDQPPLAFFVSSHIDFHVTLFPYEVFLMAKEIYTRRFQGKATLVKSKG